MKNRMKSGLVALALLSAIPAAHAGWFCNLMCNVGGFFVGAGCVAWETAEGLYCVGSEMVSDPGMTLEEFGECAANTWEGYTDCVDNGADWADDCKDANCE